MEYFLKNRQYLFWYVKDLNKLIENVIVEHILNYGDWEDFKGLINILGLEKIAEIFYQDIKKNRNNYRPEVQNYFQLYFQKYVLSEE